MLFNTFKIFKESAHYLQTQDETGRIVLEAFIDPHDNRITITHFNLIGLDNKAKSAAIENFCNSLKTYGGKQFIVIPMDMVGILKDESTQKNFFENHGFSTEFKGNTERIRITQVKSIQPSSAESFTISLEKERVETHLEQILTLMQNSGFTQAKINDYKLKGKEGIPVMFQSPQAIPVMLMGPEQKLLGMFRITRLAENIFYLSDTLVAESDPQKRPAATQVLYKTGFDFLLEQKIVREDSYLLLIAPPERVSEFQQDYGCRMPNQNNEYFILADFSAARPELQKLMDNQTKSKASPPPPGSDFSCHYPYLH